MLLIGAAFEGGRGASSRAGTFAKSTVIPGCVRQHADPESRSYRKGRRSEGVAVAVHDHIEIPGSLADAIAPE
jgi:hypothetical protein